MKQGIDLAKYIQDEITLDKLMPKKFYINKEGDMVGEITIGQANIISTLLIELQEDNNKLNNITNELEKYLIKQIDYTDGCDMFLDEQHEAYSNSLNKLQELKGVNKEWK